MRTTMALVLGVDPPAPHAAHAEADAGLVAHTLQAAGIVQPDHLRLVRGAEATPDALSEALAWIERTLPDEGRLIVYYAGDGRLLPGDPASPHYGVALHPVGGEPTAVWSAHMLRQFVERLGPRTRDVTLIFEASFPSSRTEANDPTGSSASRAAAWHDRAARPSEGGWLRIDHGVVVTAARVGEIAASHVVDAGDGTTPPLVHGTFTWYLCEALLRAQQGETWRTLHGRVSAHVRGLHPRQRPHLEQGHTHTVFAGHKQPRTERVRVKARHADGRLVLDAGAAHGMGRASLWRLSGPAEPDAPRWEVTEVRSTTSIARPLAAGADVPPGAWLEWEGSRMPRPTITLSAAPDGLDGARVDDIVAALCSASPLLDPAPTPAHADVVLHRLAARSHAEDTAPLPLLGPLTSATWAAVGRDGRLIAHLHADGPHAIDALRRDLEAVARYRNLLLLDHLDPRSRVADVVRLDVQRGVAGGPLAPATPESDSGLVLFEEGDVAEFTLRNEGASVVWITVLEFGTDGAVQVLYPEPTCAHGQTRSQPLPPGGSLRIGADHYEMPGGLPLALPERFPWAAEPGEQRDEGHITLKVLVTGAPADFHGLAQAATRSVGPASPLEPVVAACMRGAAFAPTRSAQPSALAPADDWGTLTTTFLVRRPPPTQPLRPDGASIEGLGMRLRTPGLAGQVRWETGLSERTRSWTAPSTTEDPSVARALDTADARTIAAVLLHDATEQRSRSLTAIPETSVGEPAVLLDVPELGEGWAPVVLADDGTGRLRVSIGARSRAGDWEFTIARPRPAPNEAPRTRALVPQAARNLFRVVAVRAREMFATASVRGAMAWEDEMHPYRLRTYTVDDYRQSPRRGTVCDEAGRRSLVRTLTPADLRAFGGAPCLLLVHGTTGIAHQTFAEFDPDTVASFHAIYGGRVLAWDHPTCTVDPAQNAETLLAMLPEDTSFCFDLVAHSRGGLVGRTLAARAETETAGRVRVRRVVTVGTPNRGTPLACADHLDAFLSLMIPVVGERCEGMRGDALRSVLQVARMVAVQMVDQLSGIDAMRPRGAYLQRLARWEAEGTSPVDVRAIIAASEVETADAALYASRLTERVFAEEHDMVVPSASAYAANGSPWFPIPAERRHLFRATEGDESAEILHSRYFEFPEIRALLVRWLGEPA
jgi:hypothetical protein